jgi:hypothetical protein
MGLIKDSRSMVNSISTPSAPFAFENILTPNTFNLEIEVS